MKHSVGPSGYLLLVHVAPSAGTLESYTLVPVIAERKFQKKKLPVYLLDTIINIRV